jgi:hypothetical protein
MWTLDGILDVLNKVQLRATYGAVAGVIGGIAQGVMRNRPANPRHSWVVAKRNGLPTNYSDNQMHRSLLRSRTVLSTREQLQEVLDRNPPAH